MPKSISPFEAWLRSEAPNTPSETRDLLAKAFVAGTAVTLKQATEDDLAELLQDLTVSVDVSTCDEDAGNRYFGTVTEVMHSPDDKLGITLLVQDARPNFDVAVAPKATAPKRKSKA